MIIAIANQKGGVGKTTTAINLSSLLAKDGYNVLIIDLDPQANATSGLGISRSRDGSYAFLNNIQENFIKKTAIPNLWLMPAHLDLCGLELEYAEAEERNFLLKRSIVKLKDKYEFIIVDTPPSLNLLTLNALSAADKIIIPMQCEYYGLEGLVNFLQTVEMIKERINPYLEILGILLTMVDYRTRIAKEVEEELRKEFAEKVFATVILRNVRLSEAPSYGLPIDLYEPDSVGAYCYKSLKEEILVRLAIYDGCQAKIG